MNQLLGRITVVTVCGTLAGCGQQPVPAPTGYAEFNHKENHFSCEYPEGWTAEGGGKSGPVWARFTKGSGEIHVSGDTTGSLTSNPLGGPTDGGAEKGQRPIDIAHAGTLPIAQEKYSGYNELSGPTDFRSGMRTGLKSEFTAKTVFGGKLHGYRATILGIDRRWKIFCPSTESDWAKLKEAFDHFLATFSRGKR